jgi:hypothetical protein
MNEDKLLLLLHFEIMVEVYTNYPLLSSICAECGFEAPLFTKKYRNDIEKIVNIPAKSYK